MTLPAFSFTFRPETVPSKDVLESYGLSDVQYVTEQTITAKGKLQQAVKFVYHHKPTSWTRIGVSEAWDRTHLPPSGYAWIGHE